MYKFERNRENKFAMKTVENKLAWVQQICNVTKLQGEKCAKKYAEVINMYFVRVCNIKQYFLHPCLGF